MKVTLTNLTYAAALSQETDAFDANLVIDGKVYGRVGNAGHGGCNHYSSQEGERLLNEYAKTLPLIETDMQDPHDPTKKFSYAPDADAVVNKAFQEALAARDLKRHLSGKVVYLSEGKIYSTKRLPRERLQALLAPETLEQNKARWKTDTVLNLLPFDQALEVFRKHA